MPSFDDFGLSSPLLDALAGEGYVTPTPIQSQAIPHVMLGRDLCGIAQTGTGKTAAFALPILHRLAARPNPTPRGSCRVLVLSPTRELASQIADSFATYGRGLPLSTAVVFGGVPLGAQQRRLAAGLDVLVATPGRLLDLIDRRAAILSNVEILVLDEADRMLDLGFIHALKRIAKLLPQRRQTLLFSATMPRAIAALAEDYLVDPVRVAVAPAATTAERVEQSVIFVPSERKRDLLTALLDDPSFDRVLVFTRTKHGADRVTRHLVGAGINAAAIHGNKSQPQRERALAGFRNGNGRVLVATDIAARGIDVEGVSHVINFELPNVPEDYVHRIGRTARAGAAGNAVAFCSDDERPYLRSIEKLTALAVPVVAMPSALRHGAAYAAAGAATSAGGRRGSTSIPAQQSARRPANGAVAGGTVAGATASTGEGGNTRRDPPRGGPKSSLPAFLHRQSPGGGAGAARRGAPQRKRTASREAAARN